MQICIDAAVYNIPVYNNSIELDQSLLASNHDYVEQQ